MAWNQVGQSVFAAWLFRLDLDSCRNQEVEKELPTTPLTVIATHNSPKC